MSHYDDHEEGFKFPSKKSIIFIIAGFVLLVSFLVLNPFAWNDGGERTVVQQLSGKQFVQFTPGVYYQGFFAKATSWPNQISVMYQQQEPDFDLEDNSIEVGVIEIMFSDGTKAWVKGITQFVLPSDEQDMILIHNTHRTPQSLVQKRLAVFTKECLQSSASLLSSDKHYGGGRTQMSQDFLDQLKQGVYLAEIKERTYVDSLDKETKRQYITQIKMDPKTKLALRKASAIAEYSITVADASLVDTDYEDKVDQRRDQIINAATATAVSRQELMKAQQQALTAKAKGEQELVEIEYATKKDQTKQVVEAQTKVAVAEQDKLQQKIQYEASILEAKKIKELAEANAYAKRTEMQADGALEKKLKAYVEVQEKWAEAFSKYTGNVVPQIQGGTGSSSNGAVNFAEIMTMKAQRDLALDMKTKGN